PGPTASTTCAARRRSRPAPSASACRSPSRETRTCRAAARLRGGNLLIAARRPRRGYSLANPRPCRQPAHRQLPLPRRRALRRGRRHLHARQRPRQRPPLPGPLLLRHLVVVQRLLLPLPVRDPLPLPVLRPPGVSRAP